MGIIGSIFSGIFGSNAANHAADTQANAADTAANLQRQNAVDALNFEKQVYGDQQTNQRPFLQAGQGATYSLANLLGIRMPQPFNATAPANPGNPNAGPDPNVNAPGDPTTFAGRGINPITGRPLPIPLAAQSAMLPANQNPFGPSGGVPLPTGSMTSFNMNAPITSPGTSGTQFQMNPPITSGGTGGAAALNGGTGTDTNPFPNGINLQNPVTTASGAPGTVPITNGGTTTNFGDTGGFLGDPSPIPPGTLFGDPGSADDNSFGSLLRGYGKQFVAPTDVTEQNDPGYKFRLQQGSDALQRSAAARGGLLSGGTAKALSDYAQGSASQEYGNVYNRALTNYQTAYNAYNNDQTNKFNRLASLAGFGQTAAGQLSTAGSNAASNVGNTLLTSGQQIGNDIQNAGAARASGYVGGANAINSAIAGGTGSLDSILLSQFL